MLNIIEIFKSIQGEGPAVGEPAIFIRFAGCPVKCKWCDTNYTDNMMRMSVAEILDAVNIFGTGIVVLTGGEPLVQDVFGLVRGLVDYKHKVHIETSGTTECFPTLPDEPIAELVCSPKTEFLSNVAKQATAWKYVVGEGMVLSEDDGLPVGLARPLNGAPIYIQPLWGDNTPVSPNDRLAVEIVKRYGYRLSLQTHKYLGIE